MERKVSINDCSSLASCLGFHPLCSGQEPSLDHPNFAVIETTAPPEWEEPEGEESEGEEEEALTPTIPPEHPNFRAAEVGYPLTGPHLLLSHSPFPLDLPP